MAASRPDPTPHGYFRRWIEGSDFSLEANTPDVPSSDLFYVLEAGEVTVAPDTRPPVTLRRGDHFGEIALPREVPRTATVTAQTDAELYALERDVFIAAVTGHAPSAAAADAVIAGYAGSAAAGAGYRAS